MSEINIYLTHSKKKGIHTIHYSIPTLNTQHKFNDYSEDYSIMLLKEQKEECKKIVDFLNKTIKGIDKEINNKNQTKLFE